MDYVSSGPRCGEIQARRGRWVGTRVVASCSRASARPFLVPSTSIFTHLPAPTVPCENLAPATSSRAGVLLDLLILPLGQHHTAQLCYGILALSCAPRHPVQSKPLRDQANSGTLCASHRSKDAVRRSDGEAKKPVPDPDEGPTRAAKDARSRRDRYRNNRCQDDMVQAPIRVKLGIVSSC